MVSNERFDTPYEAVEAMAGMDVSWRLNYGAFLI